MKDDDRQWQDLRDVVKEVEELKERLKRAQAEADAAAANNGLAEHEAPEDVQPTDGAVAATAGGGEDTAVTQNDMLAVGSVYEGDIAIPGITGMDSSDSEGDSSAPGRQVYTLEVLRTELDELGQEFLLGKHAAYGDEQLCHLLTADGKALSYADGETQCSGTMDPASKTISGKVCQLLPGEEGFYAPSTEVTHTFRLALVHSTCGERAVRAGLIAARQRRLCLLVACVAAKQGGLEPRRLQDLKDLKLDPSEILTDVVDAAEAVCARFRRQASLLQGLAFASHQHRHHTIADVAKKGLSRAAAHAVADSALTAFTMIELIDRQGQNRFDLIQDKLNGCLKAHQRLGLAFHRLDKSLQSAEQRLPQDVLSGWAGAAEGGEQCMICLLDLEPGEAVLQLPCAHKFHRQCGTEWFRRYVTCPNCRLEVGKEAEAAHRGKLLADSTTSSGDTSAEEAGAAEAEAGDREDEEGKKVVEGSGAEGEDENLVGRAVGWVRGLFH